MRVSDVGPRMVAGTGSRSRWDVCEDDRESGIVGNGRDFGVYSRRTLLAEG